MATPKNNISRHRTPSKGWIKTAVFFLVLILINLFVVNITFISGESMLPTLKDKQIALVLKMGSSYECSDIVVTTRNNALHSHLIKRVIATEGQHLVIQDRDVYVDGVRLNEPYVAKNVSYANEIDTIIPPGMLFLMGDNRLHSVDSRKIGVIPSDEVIGKVILY